MFRNATILAALSMLLTFVELAHSRTRKARECNAPAVFFLLNEKAVLGYGHSALLIRSKGEWDYFTFDPPSKEGANTLVHKHFDSLASVAACKDLEQYTKYLCWTTIDERRLAAVRERVAKEWDNSVYDLFNRNCCHMVDDCIQAGSFKIDITSSVPIYAFKINQPHANFHGTWPLAQR